MSAVFPSRMLASCANGHEWQVDVEWKLVPVAGVRTNTVRRIAGAVPAFCETCFIEHRRAAPATGFRHVDGLTSHQVKGADVTR